MDYLKEAKIYAKEETDPEVSAFVFAIIDIADSLRVLITLEAEKAKREEKWIT